MFTKRIAIVSVINDLVTDNRVLRTAEVLNDSGYEVLLVGRKLSNSLPLPSWSFGAIRMRLLFIKGPLFYLFFNLRLFFVLIFRKSDVLIANDLDTLLPNFLVSRIKRIPLIYDSHELFCEVPELKHTRLKKRIWESLEGWIVPRLKYCITVNQSIAGILEKKYGTKFAVVRNIATTPVTARIKSRAELNLPENKQIILLQGAGINIDRGAEELVEAMKYVEQTLLLIIGGGDVWPVLEQKVKEQHLGEKVRLIKKIKKEELAHYTHNANLGLSIDKNTNLNYFYSLPNKIFDYIHAKLPMLVSRLPEIEQLINSYSIGEFIESHDPDHIAKRIHEILGSTRLAEYRVNCEKASKDLTWEKEREILKSIVMSVGGKM